MEKRVLKELIEEVLVVCALDDTGVTFTLLDLALQAGAELVYTKKQLEQLLNEA